MNEIALSNDLKQIELEINHHKNIAGQSIWEIGRRLNHVKDNDLAHGQFGKWLDQIDMNHRVANQMMRVSKEIPNSSTYSNLGYNVLYLIATLPEEQKQERLDQIEQGENPTVKELQEQKRAMKEMQEKHKRALAQKDEVINKSYETITYLQSKEKEVIEVEKIPDDYDALKESNQKLAKELELQKLRFDELVDLQKEEEKHTMEYEEREQAIKEMEGKMSRNEKRLQNQNYVYDLIKESKETLTKVTPIPYLIDIDFLNESEPTKRMLESLADRVRKFSDELDKLIAKTNIIEGEIIDD